MGVVSSILIVVARRFGACILLACGRRKRMASGQRQGVRCRTMAAGRDMTLPALGPATLK
jgi:hypothetical protein